MLDQLQGLHIEPTNMCTLKCPRCSRTEFINQFPKKWTNKNLDLDALKNFLDIDLSDKDINLCGTYGDPIYYNRLFEMVEYFKKMGSKINIATNGSYQSAAWWQQLGDLLDSNDQITFGIDGMPDNFIKYRINADWKSIRTGIDILREKSVKMRWQFIPFSYNEDQIDQARNLALSLGFSNFFVLNSERWDHGAEALTPKTIDFISESKIKWKQGVDILVDPQCKKNNKDHYISADGFYTPCCYAAEHRWYYKSEFYKNKDLYDISKTTLSEVLDNLKNFYNTLEDAKLNYCTFNCPKL